MKWSKTAKVLILVLFCHPAFAMVLNGQPVMGTPTVTPVYSNQGPGLYTLPISSTNPKPSSACATALTQYAAPAGYAGSSNWPIGSGQTYYSCNVPSGLRYCGISTPMNFATTANGGLLCPGLYTASGYCVQVTAGGCGGNSCGWSVSIFGAATPANLTPGMNNGGYSSPSAGITQFSVGTSVIGGCYTTHNNPCPNNISWLGTGTFSYDTKKYSSVFMENTSESAATTAFCSVTMTASQLY